MTTIQNRRSIDFEEKFSSALPYDDYLKKFGNDLDREKWQSVLEKVSLSDEQTTLLNSFQRKMKVLCMTGAWCGDCVRQCPAFYAFSRQQSKIEVRFIDRDADEEFKKEMTICGAARVPQVLFLSEDDQPVGRYGDRTLSYYRDMHEKISGAACATGFVDDGDPLFDAVVQDWLDEFERIQLILRTSPRLREKHGD